MKHVHVKVSVLNLINMEMLVMIEYANLVNPLALRAQGLQTHVFHVQVLDICNLLHVCDYVRIA